MSSFFFRRVCYCLHCVVRLVWQICSCPSIRYETCANANGKSQFLVLLTGIPFHLPIFVHNRKSLTQNNRLSTREVILCALEATCRLIATISHGIQTEPREGRTAGTAGTGLSGPRAGIEPHSQHYRSTDNELN